MIWIIVAAIAVVFVAAVALGFVYPKSVGYMVLGSTLIASFVCIQLVVEAHFDVLFKVVMFTSTAVMLLYAVKWRNDSKVRLLPMLGTLTYSIMMLTVMR